MNESLDIIVISSLYNKPKYVYIQFHFFKRGLTSIFLMYPPRLYPGYIPRYSHIIPQRIRLTVRETRWRVAWPYIITLILASFMLIFTLIIFILEIASLAIDNSNTLSNTASTGAGIWCSLIFITAIIFMFLLGNYLKTIEKLIKIVLF